MSVCLLITTVSRAAEVAVPIDVTTAVVVPTNHSLGTVWTTLGRDTGMPAVDVSTLFTRGQQQCGLWLPVL